MPESLCQEFTSFISCQDEKAQTCLRTLLDVCVSIFHTPLYGERMDQDQCLPYAALRPMVGSQYFNPLQVATLRLLFGQLTSGIATCINEEPLFSQLNNGQYDTGVVWLHEKNPSSTLLKIAFLTKASWKEFRCTFLAHVDTCFSKTPEKSVDASLLSRLDFDSRLDDKTGCHGKWVLSFHSLSQNDPVCLSLIQRLARAESSSFVHARDRNSYEVAVRAKLYVLLLIKEVVDLSRIQPSDVPAPVNKMACAFFHCLCGVFSLRPSRPNVSVHP